MWKLNKWGPNAELCGLQSSLCVQSRFWSELRIPALLGKALEREMTCTTIDLSKIFLDIKEIVSVFSDQSKTAVIAKVILVI